MAHDYIARDDAGFRTWAESFAHGISADPARYMVAPAQAAFIQRVVDDFVAAFAVSSNEATRTKATIIRKCDSRSAAESLCRRYAILIKDNAGIDDADKVNIGVRPLNVGRQAISCPQTSPLVHILGNTPGMQILEYGDATSPDSRAKPFGATELLLFVGLTTTGIAPLSEARFIGKFTRNPIAIKYTEADDGKVATYYGRWGSARGEVGPWSLPARMRIAA